MGLDIIIYYPKRNYIRASGQKKGTPGGSKKSRSTAGFCHADGRSIGTWIWGLYSVDPPRCLGSGGLVRTTVLGVHAACRYGLLGCPGYV